MMLQVAVGVVGMKAVVNGVMLVILEANKEGVVDTRDTAAALVDRRGDEDGIDSIKR